MRILLLNIDYPLSCENGSILYTVINKIISNNNPDKPINLQILAALTPKDYKIDIKICRYKDIDFNQKYDLIGISFTTEYALEAYKIADEFRCNGNTVLMGGYHASALPYEAKKHADSVVIGEAEETWSNLLDDYKNKHLKPFYYQKNIININKIPRLNDHIKTFGKGIQATRGCPYGCEFCTMTNMKFKNVFRKRKINDVISELKSMKSKYFAFYDNSLTIDPNYSKNLFKKMIGLNKKFIAYGNINILGKDDELLKLASEAGCLFWSVGFESIFQKNINGIGKKTNVVRDYYKAVKKIHDYGINIIGSFIFGFDSDTKNVFKSTIDYIKYSNIDIADINILTPYPGTPLFNRLKKEKRILTKDWSKYNLHNAVFIPKNMSSEYLEENTDDVIKELYSFPSILKRVYNSIRKGNNFQNVAYYNLRLRNEYNFIDKFRIN